MDHNKPGRALEREDCNLPEEEGTPEEGDESHPKGMVKQEDSGLSLVGPNKEDMTRFFQENENSANTRGRNEARYMADIFRQKR